MEDPEMCENDIIKDVMTSMGWQDSFVPYASEESKNLMEAIKFLGNTKLERLDLLECQNKEAARVSDLFISVDGEFDQNLKLLTAHKSQYSTEYHLFKLAEHGDSNFKQMLKETEKMLKEQNLEQENLKSKFSLFIQFSKNFSPLCYSYVDEKENINKSIEKLTEGVQWAKSALAEWRKVMISGEETKKMIEKFCRMDAGRAESLDSKRKLLHEAIIKQQGILLNVYEEKKSLELLLERTGQLYRQAHLERRHLVGTWKDAVNQMNQREKEIRETEAEIESAKKVTDEKRSALQREEMMLKLKEEENRETEYLIQKLNINSSDLRNRLIRLEDSVAGKSSELLALRKTVQSESEKLNNMRNQNRQMLVQEKEKETLLKATIEELKKMHEKFEKFKNSNCNAQERLRQIEEMLEAENKNIKTIQDETIRLHSALYRSEQQLKKLQEAERNLILECQALEAGISRTRASCKSLAKELLRQTEILYNVDYNIQHAEMRMASMKGKLDDEEAILLDRRRKHLEEVLEDKVKADELMKTQIARIDEDMRKLSIIYQNSIAEFERIVSLLKKIIR